ncbi:MAG: type II 3-dehydroquinate dehydratase [Candidatus Krumholzibacteriia bacterium]
MTHRVLVLNGPNLNLLGRREPEVYGSETLADVEERLRRRAWRWPALQLEFFQSNGEGELIDWLHEKAPGAHGAILNPGGLTHTSVALRDAVAAAGLPAIEVHISNIYARESFRRRSLLAGVCVASLCGLGTLGYEAALECLARNAGLQERS